MQPWAEKFYKSKVWQRVRQSYYLSKHGICEECSEPGIIVHHKIKLTPYNIHNPEISLNPKHLKLVCRECHGREHGYVNTAQGLTFDDEGNLIQK